MNYKNGTMKEPSPLLLSQYKTNTDFLYPTNKRGIIVLERSQKLYLACPGQRNHFVGIKDFENLNEIEIECLYHTIFVVDSCPFDLSELTCKYLPTHKAKKTTKRCFNGTTIQVGYELEKKFITNYEVCKNDKTHWTYYTKFYLSDKIGNIQTGYPRPRNWLSGDFYENYDMNYLYKITTQLKTITELVGSAKLANKYLNFNKNRFMARGHMTAKADFIYGNVQRSTFWYLNAAPQWQSFNNGNWKALENDVRQLAEKRSLNLVVYTGIYGQMTLPDINGNQTPVFLFVDGRQRGLAVPRFYWKIIYDPIEKIGTAFVGLNDPYINEIHDHLYICNDISDKIYWLTWKPANITRGVSYACTIDDLRKVVKSIPYLCVRGILV